MFTAKLGGDYRAPLYLLPHACTASPATNVLHQSGPFMTVDEPTLTNASVSPKVHGCVRLPSWWCTFYGFGQTYDGTYPL